MVRRCTGLDEDSAVYPSDDNVIWKVICLSQTSPRFFWVTKTPRSTSPPDLSSAQTIIVYINKAFILHPILPLTPYHWEVDIIISLKRKWGRAWNNIYITLRDEGGRDRAVQFVKANDFSFFPSLWSGLPITCQWSCVERGNGSITHLHYCQWGHSGPWFLSSWEGGDRLLSKMMRS